MNYSKNPSLHYLRVSNDEVVVKGSHLEGFSLVISDDKHVGLAGRVVDSLDQHSSVDDIWGAVRVDQEVEKADVESLLQEMADAGALVRHGERQSRIADWIGFLRYGTVDSGAQQHAVHVYGSEVGAAAVHVLQEMGFDASHRGSFAGADLSPYVVVDASKDVAERLLDDASATDALVGEADLPDDDGPRLAVVVEGAPLRDLYRLNEEAVRLGAAVLYAQVAGSDYAIGPQVVPGATACFWEFERQRARSLFSYSEYAILSAVGDDVVTPAVTSASAASALVPYLIELALLGRSMLAGSVLRGRATTGETSRHNVMRLPRCPTCLAQRPILRNLLF